MHLPKNKLLNLSTFKLAVEKHNRPLELFKKTIKNAHVELLKYQNEGVSAAELVEKYTWMIDQLVILAWQQHVDELPKSIIIELVAVGGYGRGELHPHSDIDLLVLLKDNTYDDAQPYIEDFLRFLWDIGVDVGHSVRSLKDCIKEARQDVTIMTNLLESRHLTGDKDLFHLLDEKIRHSRVWPANKFYLAKEDEQNKRHAQYQDTAYSLEPNIKESPGGLRDLQIILWVYNRHYGVKSFKEMNEQGHINDDEYRVLIRARNVLWKIRSSLHLISNRHEDRLLFDTQRLLAEKFGYKDTKSHLAVEQLMKRYYRTAKQIIYLNEILLANYRVTNNKRFSLAVSKNLDDDFILKNKMIMQRRDNLFSKKPQAMLKLFVLMQEHKITIIHPDTIRAIRANLDQVNNGFRNNKECQTLFLQLFKSEGIGLTNALARMNAYGLLGAYLPSFGAIVGQMQHDLFHVYTVDGHTLMVLRNLTRLRKYPEEFKTASSILENLYRPERLFIGALFHDIAKGRGGDHSILGEKDAYEFCLLHGMSEFDAKLVGWLVLNHLIMSHYSQRRDISDPEVIKEFADIVGDIEHLNNLYLLTLADIRGTSPKVWNAWKGQLLLELYNATRNALRQGIAQPINEQEHIEDDKREAFELVSEQLKGQSIDRKIVEQFWQTLPNDYFIRNEPYYIAWHTTSIYQAAAINFPVVSVRFSERLEANMFFVFAPDSKRLLTQVTASFDSLQLNIIEARLQLNSTNFALYSFTAIVSDQDSAKKKNYMRLLEKQIRDLILAQDADKKISRRNASRALKHFPIQPRVIFTFNNPNYTAMEVIAQDQPGLLHNVARILQTHNIRLLNARIATFGERAEDMFYIQRHDHTAVVDESLLKILENEICSALDRSEPAKQANKKSANA